MTEQNQELDRIVESARRLGIEMDEAEALRWLSAMAAGAGGDVVFDTGTGVYGHRVSMLDFSDRDLVRFRELGRIVGFEDRPGVVETALALSGSAAQSKIQTFPGDCDYFERINIHAPTREEAVRILAEIVREKALATADAPTHRLMEVKFGTYPFEVIRDGVTYRAGGSISWTADLIREGAMRAERPDGTPVELRWEDVANDPGWLKLDWVVADPPRGRVANASNMLDVTWEAPDGTITPLDGYLDSYYQEIYLEAESIPLFSKLARNVLPDALDQYVAQLEHEVQKYLSSPENYGKAAKRMYNVFRLTGWYEEAAYIRELFDEPTSVLYQVASLIRTLDEAAGPESAVSPETLAAQTDSLIGAVERTVQGEVGAEIAQRLTRLRESLLADRDASTRTQDVVAAKDQVSGIVNAFFRDRLAAVPAISEYMAKVATPRDG